MFTDEIVKFILEEPLFINNIFMYVNQICNRDIDKEEDDYGYMFLLYNRELYIPMKKVHEDLAKIKEPCTLDGVITHLRRNLREEIQRRGRDCYVFIRYDPAITIRITHPGGSRKRIQCLQQNALRIEEYLHKIYPKSKIIVEWPEEEGYNIKEDNIKRTGGGS